ncbi:MAG: potassium-transporting ATPase subunit KdpC, partial [Clostridia bacterium]|nr:potassium-transporting ATPase subunit KdpC [Clostridia bacterium]
LVTGLAHLLFPDQAEGSLVVEDGRVVGSRLIGQAFTGARFFHGRPSATPGGPYDASASGASNLGPLDPRLREEVAARAEAVRRENGLPPGAPVPSDLVTSSASGLDPDISPEAAFLQVPRVARANRLPEAEVRRLVAEHVVPPQFGFLGQPRVNVLELNLALLRLASGRGE